MGYQRGGERGETRLRVRTWPPRARTWPAAGPDLARSGPDLAGLDPWT